MCDQELLASQRQAAVVPRGLRVRCLQKRRVHGTNPDIHAASRAHPADRTAARGQPYAPTIPTESSRGRPARSVQVTVF